MKLTRKDRAIIHKVATEVANDEFAYTCCELEDEVARRLQVDPDYYPLVGAYKSTLPEGIRYPFGRYRPILYEGFPGYVCIDDYLDRVRNERLLHLAFFLAYAEDL